MYFFYQKRNIPDTISVQKLDAILKFNELEGYSFWTLNLNGRFLCTGLYSAW
jgi:hypothetical protein